MQPFLNVSIRSYKEALRRFFAKILYQDSLPREYLHFLQQIGIMRARFEQR